MAEDDTGAWAGALGLPPPLAAEFARLAAAMGSELAAVLRATGGRVVEVDRDMRALGLRGVGYWASGAATARVAADEAIGGLPLDVRPTGFMWPADVPFPWSAEECRAAVLGYKVRWKGDLDHFDRLLRGDWEMSDGYADLRQS